MQNILQHPHLIKLNEAFQADGKYSIRLVGGCVRDILRGDTPKDIDLCTDAIPTEVIRICESAGWSVIPTGLQHGTVTTIIDHTPYEITTLRIDVETDGRHAQVEFTTDWEQDAARRDLTINAMSMDFDGNIYDYFNGVNDIKQNIIRFVGNCEERIREDYLRILRYFRFMARFNAAPADNMKCIFTNREGLRSISRERVWAEMSKIFAYPHNSEVMRLMQKYGVLEAVDLPEMDYRFFDAITAEAKLATFFIGRPDAATEFCSKWRLSTAETNKVVWIADASSRWIGDLAIEDMVNSGINREWIVEAIRIKYGNVGYLVSYAEEVSYTEFPVRGQDLLDMGMKPGSQVGQTLKMLRHHWVKSRYTLTKDELLTQVII